MKWTWGALAVVALWTTVTRTGAADAPLPLELTWDAPESCPNTESIRQRVEQILRGPPSSSATVVARGKVETSSDGRFHLALTIRSGDLEETRALDAATCSALAEAAGVLIALAIDPSRTETSDAPVEPPVPSVPSSPSSKRAEPPPRREDHHAVSAPIEPPPPRVAIGVGAAFASGTLPDSGGGVLASGALRVRRFRAGLFGTYFFPQSASFDRGAGATFGMFELGAFGGYLFPVGPVAFGPSAELEATFVAAKGFGIREPRVTSTWWPTVVLGGRVEGRLARNLGLFTTGDMLLPIGAPTFTLATAGAGVKLHQPSLPALRVCLGIEIVVF